MVLEQLQDGYKISLIYMYTSSFQNAVWADCKESKKKDKYNILVGIL